MPEVAQKQTKDEKIDSLSEQEIKLYINTLFDLRKEDVELYQPIVDELCKETTNVYLYLLRVANEGRRRNASVPWRNWVDVVKKQKERSSKKTK